ncbi:unnamed protein product [Vitrella brassicaformis CCMP3155]|uniref:Ammonium transporter AmtB-like domain-containing protein n=1 Tax=Vitrella brassicaformis (strain CCMP3155) TaxID=1169540 RepID=A0A0G4F171_VITBC|nr:unnamed protein product [Vitrella brassicaformis CCMP3155]|eukprot:CEM05279.1 unnamed protein product [Vitrella brassicaformis CCMP3155]
MDPSALMAEIESLKTKMAEQEELNAATFDTLFIILSAIIISFMQGGLALLEAGMVASKNVQHILMKNLFDVCFGTIAFWLVGYAFAFGDDTGIGFIGMSEFAGIWPDIVNRDWFFLWTFCTVTASIISGALAERTDFRAYAWFVLVECAIVFPVLLHWGWHPDGWLLHLDPISYKDFAGAGLVHFHSGTMAFMGAWLVGPRLGRFDPAVDQSRFKPHNVPLYILGVFALWMGWYSFNTGSNFGISRGGYEVVSVIAANTTLSGTLGAVTCFVIESYLNRKELTYDLEALANGVLSGLVAICGGCNSMYPWGAVLTGIGAGISFILFKYLCFWIKVDDPLGASAVHGAAGFWGVFMAGLLNKETGGMPMQVAAQFIGLASVLAWSVCWSLAIWLPCKWMGIMRCPPEEEEIGQDVHLHGGSGYRYHMDALPGEVIETCSPRNLGVENKLTAPSSENGHEAKV